MSAKPFEVTSDVVNGKAMLICDCGASVAFTSKASARFAKRHPKLCWERKQFVSQLATGTRSVDADRPLVWQRPDDDYQGI